MGHENSWEQWINGIMIDPWIDRSEIVIAQWCTDLLANYKDSQFSLNFSAV